MKLKFIFVLVVVSFSFCGVLGTTQGHAKSQSQTADTLATIKSRGQLIVGADTTYAPFESIDPATNMPVGFDVDLAKVLAADLGVNLTYQTSAWDPIIPNLQQSKFDIILSAMTITSERAQEVDFTRWYYQSFQAWLMPKTNPLALNTLSDLNKTGLRVGVQQGTTEDLFMNTSLPNCQPHRYADVPTAFQALKQGSLDVVLGDYAVVALIAKNDTNYVIGGQYSPEPFGIAVRKGDTALLGALNDALNGLLGTNQSAPQPTDLYNAMYATWFDVNAPGYTGTVTAYTGTVTLPSNVTLKYDTAGGSAPGFELYGLFAIALIPIVRKLKVKKIHK
jgi:polar amino acid transport system substrate-binding protein